MSGQKFVVSAQKRGEQGRGASRRLRRLAAMVPGIIYGGQTPPMMISIEAKLLNKLLENEAFYSHILTIDVDGQAEKAVIKDLQRHPFKPTLLHVDFQRITGNEKISMHVPLHFIGEEIAPGVKVDKGIVTHMATEIEVRCLPDFLPEFIEVNLSQLKAGESIHISDLKLPEQVESTELLHGNDLALASIHLPRVAVEEGTSTAEAGAVPVEAKGKEKEKAAEKK